MICFFKKVYYWLRNSARLRKYRKNRNRRLEIGPGICRLEGFESLNIVSTGSEDYVANATNMSLFADNEFSLVYASHILEHVPWYQAKATLKEWVRILKPGGFLEVWVPDGLKICRALVDYEDTGNNYIHKDGWYKFNDEMDPAVWAAGRIFTYGDGIGGLDHENWHRAIFTPRLLKKLMEEAGLADVRQLDRAEVRGYDHGWINMGMCGVKMKGTP